MVHLRSTLLRENHQVTFTMAITLAGWSISYLDRCILWYRVHLDHTLSVYLGHYYGRTGLFPCCFWQCPFTVIDVKVLLCLCVHLVYLFVAWFVCVCVCVCMHASACVCGVCVHACVCVSIYVYVSVFVLCMHVDVFGCMCV